MATTESFSAMLKRYMPYELLVEEMKKRNYFWNKIKKDSSWMGGTLDVPFEGAEASSLSFGALTASNDVAEHAEVAGYVSVCPELWGTMKFNEKDLERHGSLEQSFLKILPGKLDQFIGRMTERVSLSLLNGNKIAKFTADTDLANGIATIDHPERLTLGEKLTLDDGDSPATTVYVIGIDMYTKRVTFSATRGGAALNIAAYTTAQGACLYLPNGNTAGFTSLSDSLLSAANGGAANLYNVAKTSYPFLQAQQHSGAAVTEANILEKIYDFFFETMTLGKGNPSEILVSMKHFKHISKKLEDARQFATSDKSAGYGFRSVKVLGNDGEMTITAIRDMADDQMFIVDWDAMKFHGNNFFERKRHLTGDEFFLERATTGYSYVVDAKFYGDLIVSRPSHCGVVHSIPALA